MHKLNIKEAARSVNIQTQEISRSKGRKTSQIFWWTCLVTHTVIFLYQATVGVGLYLSAPVTAEETEQFFNSVPIQCTVFCAPFTLSNQIFETMNITTKQEMLHFYSLLMVLPPFLESVEAMDHTDIEKHFKKMKQAHPVSREAGWEPFIIHSTSADAVFESCKFKGLKIDCKELGIMKMVLATDICFVLWQIRSFNQTTPGHLGALEVTLSKKSFAKRFRPPESIGWNLWFVELESVGQVDEIWPHRIPEGSWVQAQVTKRINQRLNRKNNPCQDVTYELNTSVLGCLAECEIAATYRTCGCNRIGNTLLLRTTNTEKFRECEIGWESFCAYNSTKNYTSCRCQQALCRTVGYSFELTVRAKLADENMTRVQIFHKKLRTVSRTEVNSLTFTTLVGTMGGQASLWLGLRAANIIQLLFYIVAFLWYKAFERLDRDHTEVSDVEAARINKDGR